MSAQTIQVPSPVNPVLDWWLAEVRQCLGETIHGVVLHGSIALGDFCPGWSDIDVCVVLNAPVSEGEGAALGKIHDRMLDRFVRQRTDGWKSGQAIEGPYIPQELVGNAETERPCYIAGGTTRKWAPCHPVSPFDRYMLAHFGQTIFGKSVCFAPPAKQALMAQANTDLSDLRNRATSHQSAIWLCGMFHWLARSLVFWRDGRMLSKSAALQHEMDRASRFSDAFRLALAVRKEGSAAAENHRSELQAHFDACALTCAGEIEDSIGGYSGDQVAPA